jgi:hypothetical protein
MALNPTPTYSQSSVSGGIPQAVPAYGFFQSGTAADAYPSAQPSPNWNVFGFQASTMVITNESANDLVYQFLQNQGQTPDNGVVKANSTLVLRNPNCSGVLFRNRNSGQNAAWILSAF